MNPLYPQEPLINPVALSEGIVSPHGKGVPVYVLIGLEEAPRHRTLLWPGMHSHDFNWGRKSKSRLRAVLKSSRGTEEDERELSVNVTGANGKQLLSLEHFHVAHHVLPQDGGWRPPSALIQLWISCMPYWMNLRWAAPPDYPWIGELRALPPAYRRSTEGLMQTALLHWLMAGGSGDPLIQDYARNELLRRARLEILEPNS